MRNHWMRLRAALAVSMLIAGTARAGVPSDGLSLRAVGFFQAESSGDGTCTVPSSTSGIPVSSDVIGLFQTNGVRTISYPDSPCLGWMELQNIMTSQGVSVERVDLRFRIAGAGRFRQFVPTRNGFPTACRQFRKATVFTGAHLFPFGTSPEAGNTGAGVPHLAFVNLLPMVDAQVITCLQQQYAGLPGSVYTSLPLIIRAVATGVTDSGEKLKSNPLRFTLTLQHLCGNGRVDTGEVCDPNAPDTCNVGPCDTTNSVCRGRGSIFCQTDADCAGRCLQEGDPMECSCLYGN